MKITILTIVSFWHFFAFGNQGKDLKNFKTSEEIMKERNITDKVLCQLACEAKFNECFNPKKPWSGLVCSNKADKCKGQCK